MRRGDARAMKLFRRNRPEPFKPYDPYEDRPRWRLWGGAGAALVAVAAAAVWIAENMPGAPPPPPPRRQAAEARVMPMPVATPMPAATPLPERPQPPPQAEAQPPPEPGVAGSDAVIPAASGPAIREGVTTAGANLRSAPAMTGSVLWTAPRGTRLNIAEERGDWFRVTAPERGREGWMHRSLVAE
jgi:hypothetical protein